MIIHSLTPCNLTSELVHYRSYTLPVDKRIHGLYVLVYLVSDTLHQPKGLWYQPKLQTAIFIALAFLSHPLRSVAHNTYTMNVS
jgi:hypothetical protein